ncbi:MAG: methyltransferase [Rhodobacteraceae bacterium]|nr:methyltransferase [Paracoccaceae bacterium]
MSQTDRLSLPFETGQIAVPDDGPILALRAQPCPAYDLFPRDRFVVVQTHFPTFEALDRAGFNTSVDAPPPCSLALVHLTRSRDENRGNIATAYSALEQGGTLVIDGAKTDGIESLLKAVKKLLPVGGAISKAHGKVFWLTKSETPAEFSLWIKALTPSQNAAGYWTKAGVFSEDKIDKGSLELVPFLADKLKGAGADLGAGWGFLAKEALATNPNITALDLIEADKGALECARLNVIDARAQFSWGDVTNLHAERYPKDALDFVISNPPFHQSRKADPALGQRFIETAAKLLKPNGVLYLVANRQLAYEATLEASFRHVERLSQTSQFKCFFARKPKL